MRNPNPRSGLFKSFKKTQKPAHHLNIFIVQPDQGVIFPWIWTKLEGNSSYKPPGAYHIAQGPQKQSEILNIIFFMSCKQSHIPLHFISFLGPKLSFKGGSRTDGRTDRRTDGRTRQPDRRTDGQKERERERETYREKLSCF